MMRPFERRTTMAQTLLAIYDGGVLRPTTPLALPDGATVHLTVEAVHPPPADAAAEQARRAEAVAFIQSLIDAKDQDELPEGYDFLQALNDNRSPGERPLFPPELKGKTW
jgi:predicted DNA-binding antitoxin AbrB/MazE fold protein